MSSVFSHGDERGQILVFTAVSLVALLGMAALSIDAAYMYDKRNRLYAAADAAAKSAAFAYHRAPGSDLWKFAQHEVAIMGLGPVQACGAGSGTTLCVHRPPSQGPYASNSNFVEAIVTAPSTSTFFGKVMGWMSSNPGARAVAGVSNPNACMIVNQDMHIGNTCPSGPGFLLNGCGLSVGGNLLGDNPNSCVEGTPMPPVSVTGTCIGTCTDMGQLTTGAAAPTDPLANLPAFTNPYGSCTAGVAPTLNPGCYSSIANSVSALNPGEYYLTGTMNVSNLTGTGVFIYLAGSARIQSGNNNTLNLTAMSTPGTYSGNTYNGIAIFQERGNINNMTVGNSFTLNVTGAIYMPSVDVVFGNHLSMGHTQCSLFIAKSLDVQNGASDWTNSGCAALFGSASFLSVAVTE